MNQQKTYITPKFDYWSAQTLDKIEARMSGSSGGTGAANPVTINGASKNSDGTITVTYTVERDLYTSGLYLETSKIGYQYFDYISSVNYPNCFLDTAITQGSYSMTLPKPPTINRVIIKTDYHCYTYSEQYAFIHLFAAPTGHTYTTMHTVTRDEALLAWMTLFVIPGAILRFQPELAIIAALYQGYQLYEGFQSVTSWTQMPPLAEGQYYKVSQYYGTNFTLRTDTWIWANKASYDNDLSYIYHGWTIDTF